MRKDEKVARVEKEKIEERSRTAEREHRLNILRSRANVTGNIEISEPKATERERFELFPTESTQPQPQKQTQDPKSRKRSAKSGDDVLADHMKNDPIFQRPKPPKGSSSKTSSTSKDYSFV